MASLISFCFSADGARLSAPGLPCADPCGVARSAAALRPPFKGWMFSLESSQEAPEFGPSSEDMAETSKMCANRQRNANANANAETARQRSFRFLPRFL